MGLGDEKNMDYYMDEEDGEEKKIRFVKTIIGSAVASVLIILVVAMFPFTLVSAGERGIVLRWGAVVRILDEGIHFRLPVAEHVEKIEIRTQKIETEAASASRDLQTVRTKIALNYHLKSETVGELWKNLGGEYQVRIIDPAIQESVKAATAKFTAEELITKRATVKDEIKSALTTRLVNYFTVDELNIVDFDFSVQFNKAIEAKVTAEQEALAAKNKLEQVKFEAEQRVTTAKAEAEAIRIQAQAITQQGGEDYVRLKSIEKWNGQLPQNLYGSAPIPFITIK